MKLRVLAIALAGALLIVVGTGAALAVARTNPPQVYVSAEGRTDDLETDSTTPEDPTVPEVSIPTPDGVARAGQPLRLAASVRGTADEFRWDFGNGQTSTEAEPEVTFDEPGTYEVTLVVSNEHGSTRATLGLEVEAPESDVSIEIAEGPHTVGAPIAFTAIVPTFDGEAFTWDFGDGGTVTGPAVEHTYTTPGFYVVQLTVDRAGTRTKATAPLTVEGEPAAPDPSAPTPAPSQPAPSGGSSNPAPRSPSRPTPTPAPASPAPASPAPQPTPAPTPAPNASFTASSYSVRVGQSATFTDTSSGNPTARTWSWGNGNTSSGASVNYAWPSPGTYTVTLTVSNAGGRDTASATVEVLPAKPQPFITGPSFITPGVRWCFTGSHTGEVVGGEWTTSFTVPNEPQYPAYPTQFVAVNGPGTYWIRLTVWNSIGETESYTHFFTASGFPDFDRC